MKQTICSLINKYGKVAKSGIDNTWYALWNGSIWTTNYSWMGEVDQAVWDQVGNGTVSIWFYANDSMGNEASNSVIVRKDIIAPEITVINPAPYDLFGTLPPVVNVEFNDPHLSDMWYRLDNGSITTLNYTWTGIIEQSVWEQMGNGTVMIILYANDSLGNLRINSVLVQKDVIAPIIIINYPNPYVTVHSLVVSMNPLPPVLLHKINLISIQIALGKQ